jgi:ribosomal protein L11 methyltransferase
MIDQMLAPLYQHESITPVPITVLPVEQRDWLAENRAAFPPLHIGRFWVYGSHVTTPRPAASLPLLIDAALAFGSGTHPTTEGCLRAMQMIRRHCPAAGSRYGLWVGNSGDGGIAALAILPDNCG